MTSPHELSKTIIARDIISGASDQLSVLRALPTSSLNSSHVTVECHDENEENWGGEWRKAQKLKSKIDGELHRLRTCGDVPSWCSDQPPHRMGKQAYKQPGTRIVTIKMLIERFSRVGSSTFDCTRSFGNAPTYSSAVQWKCQSLCSKRRTRTSHNRTQHFCDLRLVIMWICLS